MNQRAQELHLAVDANGRPLHVRLGPGNENERAHLLPLIDELITAGYRPDSVWADRGYCSNPLRQALLERSIEPQISRRRRRNDPLPDSQPARHPKARGRKQRPQPRPERPPPLGRRTHQRLATLLKRLTIRTEPNSQIYLAYLTLALTIILARAL